MRKDWHTASAAAPQGAAAFWDAHWESAGAAPTAAELRASDEYRCLGRLVPGFRRGGLTILDCGCGRGQWMTRLQEDGHRCFGVDLARETLKGLPSSCKDAASIADFRRLAFGANRFDLLINWGGIEHDEAGPAAALREALRVLRPGGHLVVTTPCHNPRVRLLDRWRGQSSSKEGCEFYQYRFTPAELRAALAGAGFEGVRSRVIAGVQGVHRSFEQELKGVAGRLPTRVRWVLLRAGGVLLRPLVGHMVVGVGRKPGSKLT